MTGTVFDNLPAIQAWALTDPPRRIYNQRYPCRLAADMTTRVLRETNEEVTRIAGGMGPPVLESWLHGRTRVTGIWAPDPYEDDAQPMQDHVICAIHSGSGNAVARLGGEQLSAPNQRGGLNILARGHGGYWRVDGRVQVSNVFLGHDRLLGCADLLAEGRPFELIDRVNNVDPKLYGIMQVIRDEVSTPGPHGIIFLERALDLLCIALLRGHSTLAYPFAQKQHGLAPWQVKRVVAYMQERLGSEITLQELANIVNQSRFHFCTAFRTATGVAPYEYLTRLRILAASNLLRSTPLSVSDVGAAVGYSSLSAFSTAFRRYAGTSPRAYRNATH
ncbi:AraC-like DNA-binding protein [Lysobacter niastensis]|uniref:AraC-like DNA-binding protein n=2 Tax=Lysobacter niastensis TaxID=380629 RepID=A0ABU1WAM8_9GAMM|nr:AraC-like DNA-binding protein [Lysobacter niastensis]